MNQPYVQSDIEFDNWEQDEAASDLAEEQMRLMFPDVYDADVNTNDD
jgi:hypothetical protein